MKAPKPAPAFTQTSPDAWLNSEPLTLEQLRGKVVLLDFWTFDCWNCYRSFPWLKSLEAKYKVQGLQVIGIHTPEFKHEKVRANVEKKIKQFGIHHPVMMDNDFGYWRAMGNRYWPAFYLIDKKGVVRALYVGETHVGDRRSQAIETWVKVLLAE
ncbi:MAG: redoxin family protein [Pseudomonadota bacterium]